MVTLSLFGKVGLIVGQTFCHYSHRDTSQPLQIDSLPGNIHCTFGHPCRAPGDTEPAPWDHGTGLRG